MAYRGERLDIRKRVDNGVALLDDYDRNWRKGVDCIRLSMKETDYCIIGQLFPSYMKGLLQLGLINKDVTASLSEYELAHIASYGFDFTLNEFSPNRFSVLTHTWKKAVMGAL